MRVSKVPLKRTVFWLAAAIVSILWGGLVSTNSPGLKIEYFAGPLETQPHPVFRGIGTPHLESRGEVAPVLVSQEIFFLRWKGWLRVEEEGEYRFVIESDEVASLELDGAILASTSKRSKSNGSETVHLDRGLHAIQVDFEQTGGRTRLAVLWGGTNAQPAPLRAEDLVAHSPAWIRGAFPWLLLTGASKAVSRSLGLGLVLIGLALGVHALRPVFSGRVEAASRWLRQPERQRALKGVFLLILFGVSCAAVFPLTASTVDGDDVRYMDAARFDKKMGWIMNRYAHVYLLKLFIWAEEGDAFGASRVYWAFLLGVLICSLGVSAFALSSGFQLPTLGLALFLLFAQSYLFLGVGAAYADYSAMMFVAAGVAVYLHGFRGDPSSIARPHLVALGALTIAAAKSKEPGLILLWLLVAMLWGEDGVNFRRFSRRFVWWVAGASAAYASLMALDAVILGDLWFSFRLESLAGAQRLKVAAESIWRIPRLSWLAVAWTQGSLRWLSVVAVLAVLVAIIRRQQWPQRAISLMPFVFMVMMIAIHPPISSARYLLPIVPVACLSGAMMVRDLASPRGSRRTGTTVLLALGLVAVFGSGFVENWSMLARHRAVQQGDWTLYPWEVFRAEIEEARPKEIHVSPRLYRTYQMMGKSRTRDRIARMFFQRRHLQVREARVPGPKTKMMVLTRTDLNRLLATRPELRDCATFDPSGQIVLLRMLGTEADSAP